MREKPPFHNAFSGEDGRVPPERHTPDRWISKLGLGTRGQVRDWIERGRLSIRGIGPVRSFGEAVPASPSGPPVFLLDGKPLVAPPPLVLAFNKPRGCVSTRLDPEGRPVPSDFIRSLPGVRERPDNDGIVPIGRLDKASAGIILLSNRPSSLNLLLNPNLEIIREYRVQVRPSLSEKDRLALSSGAWAREWGFKPPVVRIERQNLRSTWMRITLTEGKNREIRKPFEQSGYEVLHLVRVRLGPFLLSGLPPGKVADVTSWFFRSGSFELYIILDALRIGDIMELKEEGAENE